MLESVLLGIVQGVTEWLPISSSGAIALVKINLLKEISLEEILRFSLFLHLGTFMAALVYFRKDVAELLKALLNYKSAGEENKKVLNFLIISFIISSVVGFVILRAIVNLEAILKLSGAIVNLAIGTLLLITAFMQLKRAPNAPRKEKFKDWNGLRPADGLLLGLAQGLAVLPGLSRSGLTVSALLLRKFNETFSLKLSFLMSLPIVLAGNIALNINHLSFSAGALAGLAFSFFAGLATIKFLMRLSQKINFGYFALLFGILVILAVFV